MQKVKTHSFGTVIATGELSAVRPLGVNKTFQVSGKVSATTGAATIDVEGSNDGVHWNKLGDMTLTLGTTSTSDSFTNNEAWAFVRPNVKTLSGTDAEVTVVMGLYY